MDSDAVQAGWEAAAREIMVGKWGRRGGSTEARKAAGGVISAPVRKNFGS